VKGDPQLLLDDFSHATHERTLFVCILWLMLASLVVASLFTGPAYIPLNDAFAALVMGTGENAIVMQEIRLPRLVISLAVGGGLGLCGAAAQSLTRNPLADPAIFGAPQAAALGAVIVLYFNHAVAGSPLLVISAISGAAVCLAVILLLARKHFSIIAVLLAGVAVGSLCSAGVSMALSLSPNPFAMAEIVFWLMGSFADRSVAHVALSLPLIVFGGVIIMRCGNSFRALTLGEDTAISMGYSPMKTTVYTAAALSMIIGATTAVSGAIGFVGLMAPHFARPFCNGDPKAILLPSILCGAILTTGADVVVRLIPSTNEIPVGVITAVLGAPFFLYLVTFRRAMFGSLQQ
jgi:iron complex transport system permease protein